MNGRCETDPLDQAIDVCDSCYGEFCQSCLVHPSGRKHPLCRDCALIVSGVRGSGKVVAKGSRRSAKSRRKELKAAALERNSVFRFFDEIDPADDAKASPVRHRAVATDPLPAASTAAPMSPHSAVAKLASLRDEESDMAPPVREMSRSDDAAPVDTGHIDTGGPGPSWPAPGPAWATPEPESATPDPGFSDRRDDVAPRLDDAPDNTDEDTEEYPADFLAEEDAAPGVPPAELGRLTDHAVSTPAAAPAPPPAAASTPDLSPTPEAATTPKAVPVPPPAPAPAAAQAPQPPQAPPPAPAPELTPEPAPAQAEASPPPQVVTAELKAPQKPLVLSKPVDRTKWSPPGDRRQLRRARAGRRSYETDQTNRIEMQLQQSRNAPLIGSLLPLGGQRAIDAIDPDGYQELRPLDIRLPVAGRISAGPVPPPQRPADRVPAALHGPGS